jgi:hypothetical protein
MAPSAARDRSQSAGGLAESAADEQYAGLQVPRSCAFLRVSHLYVIGLAFISSALLLSGEVCGLCAGQRPPASQYDPWQVWQRGLVSPALYG